jgi:hypothetical protein
MEPVVKQLASAFVDADGVQYSEGEARELAVRLEGAFEAQSLVEQPQGGGRAPRKRFAFVHRQTPGLTLVLSGNRFDVQRVGLDIPTDSLPDFLRSASAVIGTALDYFGRRSHRLATVVEGLVADVDGAACNEARRRAINLPNLFQDAPIVEWDWRAVARVERQFGALNETTNTIGIVKRAPIERTENGVTTELERLYIQVDINTLPDAIRARFGPAEAAAYFEASGAWLADVERGITRFLEGADD